MNIENYSSKIISLKKILLLVFVFIVQLSFSQNDCATALPITAGIYTIDAINGTQVPSPVCAQNGTGATAGEWYVYTPTDNHSVTVTTDLTVNACSDTRLHVYIGSCASLTCLGGDDDAGIVTCPTSTNTYLSTLTFDAIAGTTYYIAFDNKWQSTGFQFKLIENIFIDNLCNTAITITAGTTTVPTISETTYSTACASATLAKWYKYIPTQDYHLTISSDLAQNICKDTNFNVYIGTCPNGLLCVSGDDNSGTLACNSGNTNSNLSKKTFDVTAGITYYIVWDNKWSTQGFDFVLTEGLIVVPVSYTTQTIATLNAGDYNLCIVDMQNDGKDDIVSINTNNLKIHKQANSGAFIVSNITVPGTSFLPSWSMAAGDYNRDGFKDLILGSGSGLSIWKSNSTGTAYTNITPGQYIFCQRTNFADLNNDGNLDVFSCHDIAPNAYYLNDSSNNLTYYQSTITPGAMSIGAVGGNYSTLFTDFDNDGDADVLISKCSGPPCELHRNDGNGVYTDISAQAQINITPIQTWSSAVADFDNDGDMDIIITASAGNHHFFRNNLDTTNNVEEAYTEITLGSGWDTNGSTNIDNVAYDFDNDGLVDVLGGGSKIMFNQGNDVFSPTEYSSLSIGAVGDLNNDGFLDILNGNVVKYAVPNGNNWIKIGLEGNLSNANGIGARVEIYGVFGKKIRDIRSGEGFRYMSTMNAHFGIGQATAISKIIIRWPSGKVDEILNPAINQYLKIVENTTNLKYETFTSSDFNIYPNPASDVLNITFNTKTEIKSAQIFDIAGRLLSEAKVNNNTIDIKSLAKGTYVLTIKNNEGKQFSEKFLKK